MDILSPVTNDRFDLAYGDGLSLGVSKVFMRVSTIRGERPYRPNYGVKQPIFMTPQEYPVNIDGVLLELSFKEGELNYDVIS